MITVGPKHILKREACSYLISKAPLRSDINFCINSKHS